MENKLFSPLTIIYVAASFLLGSVPFGYITARILGRDITKEGSGNIGATNVSRVLGPVPGIIVLIFDALKGYLPVYFCLNYVQAPISSPSLINPLAYLCGIAAVLGHSFSPFLKFRGGKGVATSFGVVLALFPSPTLSGVLTFTVIVLLTRVVSVASICASSVVLFLVLSSEGYDFYGRLFVFFACLIIILRHRSNIERILSGEERQFSFRR